MTKEQISKLVNRLLCLSNNILDLETKVTSWTKLDEENFRAIIKETDSLINDYINNGLKNTLNNKYSPEQCDKLIQDVKKALNSWQQTFNTVDNCSEKQAEIKESLNLVAYLEKSENLNDFQISLLEKHKKIIDNNRKEILEMLKTSTESLGFDWNNILQQAQIN